MMHGLQKGDDKMQIGREIMNALFALKADKDKKLKTLRYKEFV